MSGRVRAMAQEQTPPCGGDEIARATVSRIGDGRTFTLADGREVRLAALEVPPMPLPQESDQAAPPGGTAAKDALDALAGGDTVVLGGNAVYETDESLSGSAYVLGGHLSHVSKTNAQNHARSRVSLSPLFSSLLAALALVLLSLVMVPQVRHRVVINQST